MVQLAAVLELSVTLHELPQQMEFVMEMLEFLSTLKTSPLFWLKTVFGNMSWLKNVLQILSPHLKIEKLNIACVSFCCVCNVEATKTSFTNLITIKSILQVETKIVFWHHLPAVKSTT